MTPEPQNQDDFNVVDAERASHRKETIELTKPNSVALVASDSSGEPSGERLSKPSPQPTTKSSKAQDKLVGTTVGDRYEILTRVGQGATTSVYKSRDLKSQRVVAVKILRSEFTSSEHTVQRFKQECKTLALLKHNNIVAYYDEGSIDEEQPYLVMEFLEGESLKQVLETSGNVEVNRLLKILVQTCAALTAAHEKSVIHRDLKPANIMLVSNESGQEIVKVLDFGVSKLLPFQGETFQTRTQTGEMLGTLLYMSPEQCLDNDLDGRSDLYSLGCVMFEMLTGTPPLTARTAFETMNKHLTQMPQALSVVRPEVAWPAELNVIIQRAVAKKPDDRYPSALAFEQDLANFLAGKRSSISQVKRVEKQPEESSDASVLEELGHFALDLFNKLDLNLNECISQKELKFYLLKSNLPLRTRAFVTFLLDHFDEIKMAGGGTSQSTDGITRADLKAYCFKRSPNAPTREPIFSSPKVAQKPSANLSPATIEVRPSIALTGPFDFGEYDSLIKLFGAWLAAVAALSVSLVSTYNFVFWKFAMLSLLPVVIYLFAVLIAVMLWEPTKSAKKGPEDRRIK